MLCTQHSPTTCLKGGHRNHLATVCTVRKTLYDAECKTPFNQNSKVKILSMSINPVTRNELRYYCQPKTCTVLSFEGKNLSFVTHRTSIWGKPRALPDTGSCANVLLESFLNNLQLSNTLLINSEKPSLNSVKIAFSQQVLTGEHAINFHFNLDFLISLSCYCYFNY